MRWLLLSLHWLSGLRPDCTVAAESQPWQYISSALIVVIWLGIQVGIQKYLWQTALHTDTADVWINIWCSIILHIDTLITQLHTVLVENRLPPLLAVILLITAALCIGIGWLLDWLCSLSVWASIATAWRASRAAVRNRFNGPPETELGTNAL